MPRFVLLIHQLPSHQPRKTHGDLMLETAAGLLTWEVPQPIVSGEDQWVRESFVHRLHYLDYEGELSDNRGSVTRFDGGTFDWLKQSDDVLQLEMGGEKLNGKLVLKRNVESCRLATEADSLFWLLRFVSHSAEARSSGSASSSWLG